MWGSFFVCTYGNTLGYYRITNRWQKLTIKLNLELIYLGRLLTFLFVSTIKGISILTTATSLSCMSDWYLRPGAVRAVLWLSACLKVEVILMSTQEIYTNHKPSLGCSANFNIMFPSTLYWFHHFSLSVTSGLKARRRKLAELAPLMFKSPWKGWIIAAVHVAKKKKSINKNPHFQSGVISF